MQSNTYAIGHYSVMNNDKPYNSLTTFQQFLTFLFTSQRERGAMKDERTHHNAMDKS